MPKSYTFMGVGGEETLLLATTAWGLGLHFVAIVRDSKAASLVHSKTDFAAN
jgi:hypothetical protein